MAEAQRVVIDVSRLTPGGTQVVEAAGRTVVLCNVGGVFYAVTDRCSHAAFSMAEGRLMGFLLECPLHGACFDVRDGSPRRRPAFKPVATYAVAVAGTRAEITLPPRPV